MMSTLGWRRLTAATVVKVENPRPSPAPMNHRTDAGALADANQVAPPSSRRVVEVARSSISLF
jgi:hypothetical protein